MGSHDSFTDSGEKRLDKDVGIERLKVVEPFTHSDEFDREVDRLANRHDDSSFCCAVQLGQNYAGTSNALGEDFSLADRVLAVGCVKDE